MKYPIINYCGFTIERKKINNGIDTKYYFCIDLIERRFTTLNNAKSYIDFLAK